ncbi:MAG: AarF/ABC1/UbiB kinase family protein [Lentisphaeria bacterium]
MLMDRVTAIGKTYRHFSRYREILRVLLKHGFGDLMQTLGVHRHLSWLGRRQAALASRDENGPSRYARIRIACEELGPTFTKLGQLLSLRRDFMPPDLAAELEKLQDHVPPFPNGQARSRIEESLGRPVEAVFRDFNGTPLASASIAQVHEATLLDGTRVVVKVRRPGIRRQMETDMEIMMHLAGLIEKHVEGAALFEPVKLVHEFARLTRHELDLSTESSHLQRFARNFAGNAEIHVPKVYAELSSERMLVMEFIDGLKVSNVEAFAAHGLDREIVAERGTRLVLEQIFIHGFFHADPHPGNLMVLPGNVICFLDYGQMGVLSHHQRELLSDLIIGLIARDERRVADAVFKLSGYCRFEQAPRIEAEILNFIEAYLYKRLGDVNLGRLLTELTQSLVAFGIHMPAEFFVLSKSLTTLDGVGRQLSPRFDVIGNAAPFAKRLLRDRFSPGRLTRELAAAAWEFQELARGLPREIHELLTLVKGGEVRLKFEHRGLEPLAAGLDLFSRRISYALILGALVVGSGLLFRAGAGPHWHGMPLLGLTGLALGLFFALPVLWAFFRQTRK